MKRLPWRAFFTVSLMCLMMVVSLPVCSVFAEDVSVLAVLDTREFPVNEEGKLSIRVSGYDGNLPRPRLPVIDGVETHYLGRSSSFNIVAGKRVQNVEYTYALVPNATGTYTLPAFQVRVGNAVYQTAPMNITVIPENGQHERQYPYRPPHVPSATNTPFSTQQTPATAPPAPTPQQVLDSTDPVRGADNNIYAVVDTTKRTVYPGEQVLMTYTIFTNKSIRYEGFETDPEYKGFWTEDLSEKENLVRDVVYVRGRPYVKAEVKKVALFPMSVGDYDVDPGSIKCSVEINEEPTSRMQDFLRDDFFSNQVFNRREKRVLKNDPVRISVIPFPDINKPENFSGASGEYKMRVSLDKTEVAINDPITMTITIDGKGNIETIERPLIKSSDDFQFFDNGVTKQVYKNSGVVQGSKSFEVMCIPKKSGKLYVPMVVFDFFHLKYKRYMHLENGPYPITVTDPAGDAAVNIPQERDVKDTRPKKNTGLKKDGVGAEKDKRVNVDSRGIHFIKREENRWAQLQRQLVPWLAWIDMILGIFFICLYVWRRRAEALNKDMRKKKRVYALTSFRKNMGQIKPLVRKKDVTFFSEVLRVVDVYFSDVFGVERGYVRSDIVEQYAKGVGLVDKEVTLVREFYDRCNEFRFGGAEVEPSAWKQTMRDAYRIVAIVEKRC